MTPARTPREQGRLLQDCDALIAEKFPASQRERVVQLLGQVVEPTGHVLRAIVFLARPGHVEDVASGVSLARDDRRALLDAATVKDERG